MTAFFDTHCDTATRITKNNASLLENDFHISLKKAEKYCPYIQVAAIFTTSKSNEDSYKIYKDSVTYFREQCKIHSCDIITTKVELDKSIESQKNGSSRAGFILCIEDCTFLTSADAVDEVYNDGVRILIPMWGKKNSLGSAHDAQGGLTDIGKTVLNYAASKNMVLDISHSNIECASEIMNIAEKHGTPVIASHSNSREFFDHTRNLYKEQAERLASLGGIAGHSLCVWHLEKDGKCNVKTVCDNVLSLTEIMGTDNVCFGCDLDGTELPEGISDISDIALIHEEIINALGKEVAEKILFTNAYNKFKQFLK